MELQDFFRDHPRAALAFSGGVDSAYLLYAAVKAGADVTAYYVRSAFQPRFEYEDACRLAKELGAKLVTIELDVLADENITGNPENRCYFCKNRIFSAILDRAKQDGYGVVMDGTNASDDASDRPGMRAIRELEIRSPLRECGLTKGEIRRLSRQAGLFTWDKPAYACLATRIPAGRPITPELLEKTERAEEYLMSLGFSDFRVRLMGDAARLQVRQEQLPLLLEKRVEIVTELKQYYPALVLDLEVRNGQ